MNLSIPKGTKDLLPGETGKWRQVEDTFRETCNHFGYREIRTPVFEHTELFQRGVGDSTDIVQKEMYTFLDKGGRSLSLRPEGTAGVVRSYIENGMNSLPQPVRMYYSITAYRYENVQMGRYREFNQLGAEAFGCRSCLMDVELISILNVFFQKLGIRHISLHINSIGCPSCRENFHILLREYYRERIAGMCQDCRNRYKRNPMRLLDCKEPACSEEKKGAPMLLDQVCSGCSEHFNGVKAGLDRLGIFYEVDRSIVRGLDYYTQTVFEYLSEKNGAQITICGGGRYNGLVEMLGGGPVPGVGFSLGLERLMMILEQEGLAVAPDENPVLYLATIGRQAAEYAHTLVFQLRRQGIHAETDLMDRSIKAQMKYADKRKARFVIVLGETEIETNTAVIRVMETGEEKRISLDSIFNQIIERKAQE